MDVILLERIERLGQRELAFGKAVLQHADALRVETVEAAHCRNATFKREFRHRSTQPDAQFG